MPMEAGDGSKLVVVCMNNNTAVTTAESAVATGGAPRQEWMAAKEAGENS